MSTPEVNTDATGLVVRGYDPVAYFTEGRPAAHDLGLGTCIMALLAFYPDLIRRHLGLTQAHKIVVGIALGYPDLDHPANAFRSQREPLEQFVRWIG